MKKTNQKKRYYRKKDVVDTYDKFRYGTPSGKLVFKREVESIRSILGKPDFILDVPCGNGRLFSVVNYKCKVIGVDTSSAMISAATKKPYHKLYSADAKKLKFKNNYFDSVVSLRFFFHFSDIFPFLSEFKRVTKRKGHIIFDTLNWSPRAIGGRFWNFLGGPIYVHSKREIESLCRKLNLEIVERKEVFLLTPFLYKYLPRFLTLFLFKIEKYFPQMLTLSIWRVMKN